MATAEDLTPRGVVACLTMRKGWTIQTKFSAPAAFFVVNSKGDKFLYGGSSEGGTLLINVHSKEGRHHTVVRWSNYMGKDGLNASIVPNLPIHRGYNGEFYFKTLSTTTLGLTRKTVFAVKIPDDTKADEFHMWWLHFNGQIKNWLRPDSNPTTIPDVSEEEAKNLVQIFPVNPKRKRDRNFELTSPKELIGVGTKRFRFENCTPKPQPRRFPKPPEDKRNEFHREHDRDLFWKELNEGLLKVMEAYEDLQSAFKCEIDSGSEDRFTIQISGVPEQVCGLLFCTLDEIARNSKVLAVVREQEYIDKLVENEEYEQELIDQKFNDHCISIPIIHMNVFGTDGYFDRLHFMSRVGSHPAITFEDVSADESDGSAHSAIVVNGKRYILDESASIEEGDEPMVLRLPRTKACIDRFRPMPMYKGTEIVKQEPPMSDEDQSEVVIVDESEELPMSQKLHF